MSFEVAETLESLVRATVVAADGDDVLLAVRKVKRHETDVCRDSRPSTTLSILQSTN